MRLPSTPASITVARRIRMSLISVLGKVQGIRMKMNQAGLDHLLIQSRGLIRITLHLSDYHQNERTRKPNDPRS